MKPLLVLGILIGMGAAAQDPAPTPAPVPARTPAPATTQAPAPAAPAKTPAAAPDAAQAPKPEATPAAPPAAAKETAAASPVPSEDLALTGSIDVGYRWLTGVGGSMDTYRSLINLGSGPKLLGADFTITDPKIRWFDRIDVRASNWGDDPYGTLHADASKSRIYDLRADYRDIAYYDNLPSYADPLLTRGVVLNEQSFDMRRRLTSISLDILPGNWFIPYLAFERDSGSGTGVTAFVTDGNEYPVPTTMYDVTALYRGGVRFELRHFHVTLEEGGTTYKNDQTLYSAQTNTGNVLTPVLGHTLTLSNLLASYGIRGSSAYSKGLFTANPFSWLDLYGQFLFSQPDANVHYQDSATGSLYLQNQALFYTSQQTLINAQAKLPHTTGSFGAEIRPLKRLRILESWLTDRMHGASSAASNQVLNTTPATQIAALLASSLVTNYNQQQIQLLFEVSRKLTLRGGYRYVWGDADSILPAGLQTVSQGDLHRQVALGGFVFRPFRNLTVTSDAEVATSTGAYFRTSLYNYQKVRAQGRYQVLKSLNLAVDFTLLNNQNPTPGINSDAKANQESLSLVWAPGASKHWELEGSYGHSYLRSNIGYLSPQDLSPQISIYTDNSHTATALFTVNLPGVKWAPHSATRITGGGSLVLSSGSRPTSYYQPQAKVSVPIAKNIQWVSEWRYYGYGEAFYIYEGFRSHLVTTGLRFTR
jgi:hypothetical protein